MVIHQRDMQRLTARFLLLLAFLGTFLPITLPSQSAPTHACCRRTGAHHCSDATGSDDEPVARDASCCTYHGSRSFTTRHWAHARPALTSVFSPNVTVREVLGQGNATASAIFLSQFTRAPPQFPIA